MGLGNDWVKISATPWKQFLMWLFNKELEQIKAEYLEAKTRYDSDVVFLGEQINMLDQERLQYLNLLNRFRQSPPVTPTEQARADAMVREHRQAEKARENVRLMRQRGWSAYKSNEHHND